MPHTSSAFFLHCAVAFFLVFSLVNTDVMSVLSICHVLILSLPSKFMFLASFLYIFFFYRKMLVSYSASELSKWKYEGQKVVTFLSFSFSLARPFPWQSSGLRL